MEQALKRLLPLVVAMLFTVSAYAQFTTSSMTGRISDENGEALVGAAVVAVHIHSGSQYCAISNVDGYYTIAGMRPGGPYELTASLIGCQTVKITDINLQLSETLSVDVALKSDSVLLKEAVVFAASSRFSNERTGASTNVSNRQMMDLPNSDRSIKALTKLSPYSNGMSFAGADGRFTNFTVDGANLNNNTGLNSGNLPGGGTPISIDAIEEIQLVVAPYDVRQSNFVGGGINAVTKSGTNTLKATAYGYYTDQSFRGNRVAGHDLGDRALSSNLQVGATVGGPIIKDKLFFFVNFEYQKRPRQICEYRASSEKRAVLQQIADKLMCEYGYDAGSYTSYSGDINNRKVLARIDWNISDAHKFSFRFNNTTNTDWYVVSGNSCDDEFRNRSYERASSVSQPFSSTMYSQLNKVMSFAFELNSRFSDKVSNRLLGTCSNIQDIRDSPSAAFPFIDIMTDGDYSSGNFIPYTSVGYELFTWNNGVKNNSWNVQDNVTIYAGSHTITTGASWELMDVKNSYMRNGTGYYRYASAEDFLTGALPLSFCLTYGYDGNANPAGEVKYNQFAVYVQDEWKITKKFKLTYGIRGDLIAFDNSAIETNPNIAAIDYGGRTIDTGAWPKTRPQVSPRIGFNWDVTGDKSVVLRGGTGFFQGRLPLVFFTNMPQYSGMIQSSYNISAQIKDGQLVYSDAVRSQLEKLTAGGKMMTDPQEIIKTLGLPTSPSSSSAGKGGNSYVSGVDQNFQMPQTWKSSLAVDCRVPTAFPFTVTVEGMYNKTIWGVCMEDWSLNNNRLTSTFPGPDNRVNYAACTDYKYDSSHAYVMTNTRKGWGYTANLTVNMTPAKNLDIMIAYTRTESKEISGMPGSAAESVFTGMPTISGTNLSGLQRSQYVVPDIVKASINYFIPFKVFHGRGLHINAYYSAASSYGNSFIYSNDMNGDGNATDLIYIPATKDEIQFTSAADAEAFWIFLNNDKYLSSHKGQYAEAYAARAPWVHRIDIRIAEDFCFKIGNTANNFQFSVSIDNLANLLNSSWGVQRLSCYQGGVAGNAIAPLKYEGIDASTGRPTFSMDKVNGAYPTRNYTEHYLNTSECWFALFGIKYLFN